VCGRRGKIKKILSTRYIYPRDPIYNNDHVIIIMEWNGETRYPEDIIILPRGKIIPSYWLKPFECATKKINWCTTQKRFRNEKIIKEESWNDNR